VAAGMLDAATYTITYQTKTIWSGIFSVALLHRTLKLQKWAGLCLLAFGVGLVQYSGVAAGTSSKGAKALDGKAEDAVLQRITGAVILLFAAALSSMAGVYFEKILKGVQISLWTRNLQLAFYSCVAAVVPLLFSGDLQIINEKGFFHGCVSDLASSSHECLRLNRRVCPYPRCCRLVTRP
jgi:drug/metabolite transporter (DMT)-like permease